MHRPQGKQKFTWEIRHGFELRQLDCKTHWRKIRRKEWISWWLAKDLPNPQLIFECSKLRFWRRRSKGVITKNKGRWYSEYISKDQCRDWRNKRGHHIKWLRQAIILGKKLWIWYLGRCIVPAWESFQSWVA